jgi:pantoate--beta-alanine ligase
VNIVDTVAAVRETVVGWKRDGLRVGLVPTMGNLHAGHLQLMDRASRCADRVVASVFVNPLQFGPDEDFEAYPRTLDADTRKLEGVGVDLLYAPGVDVMYAGSPSDQTRVEVPGLSSILCGASRPGHFSGVATVVCKLFNQVQPDVAVFGEKDFQQLMVIRRMVADLDSPVVVLGEPTMREADGLALSSRNRYLSAGERAAAPALLHTLRTAADALRAGRRDYATLEEEASERLESAGFVTDYVSIRRAADLAAPEASDRHLVVLAAAFLGRARLIDNVQLEL